MTYEFYMGEVKKMADAAKAFSKTLKKKEQKEAFMEYARMQAILINHLRDDLISHYKEEHEKK